MRSIVLIAALSGSLLHAQQVSIEDFSRVVLPPRLEKSIVYDTGAEQRRIQNPSIVEGEDGALIAAWSNKGARGDNDPSSFIQASTSDDGGRTWTRPVTAAPASSINATFMRTVSGDVLLFYNRNRSDMQDDTEIVFRRSSDNGRTWSDATYVDTGFPVNILVHNGILLSNGEWLLPFHYDRSGQGEPFSVSRTDFVSAIAISADEGKSWRRYGAIEIPNEVRWPNITNWAVEPAVAEVEPGKLLMIIRSRAGRLYEARSSDFGRTWSKAAPTNFSSPDSKISLERLSSGSLLLGWNNSGLLRYRYPLLLSLSQDYGGSWPFTVTLDDDNLQLDYPASWQAKSGIYVVYGHDLKRVLLSKLDVASLRSPWTAINDQRSWEVRDGALRRSAASSFPSAQSWLAWSKVVNFTARREIRSVEVDVRFDEAVGANTVGLFAPYQDESNWTALVWSKGAAAAGIQEESHMGFLPPQGYSSHTSRSSFSRAEARPGVWYRMSLSRNSRNVTWRIAALDTGTEVASGAAEARWRGAFVALGSREGACSFDNLKVVSGTAQ